MTRPRHIAVARYLIGEGGFPFATKLDRSVLGQPEGVALLLPRPFESIVVVGQVQRGLRRWAQDHSNGYRLIVLRNAKQNDLDDLTVEIPLRAFAELTRRYYE